MPLQRQQQVLDGLDDLAGRAMRRASRRYRQSVVAPMITAMDRAASPAGLLRALGPSLFRRMDTNDVEDALADCMTQAELIGEVSATPQGDTEPNDEE